MLFLSRFSFERASEDLISSCLTIIASEDVRISSYSEAGGLPFRFYAL